MKIQIGRSGGGCGGGGSCGGGLAIIKTPNLGLGFQIWLGLGVTIKKDKGE